MTHTRNTSVEAFERVHAGDVVRALPPGGGGWAPAAAPLTEAGSGG